MTEFDNFALSASRLQRVRYMQASSMTILVIEWALVLGDEIELIWKTRWSIVKVLYILSRYSAFVDTSFNLTMYVTYGISVHRCHVYYSISTVFTFIGMVVSELILLLRTYALYRSSPKILWILGTAWVVLSVAGALILYYFLKSISFGPLPSSEIPGCLITNASEIVAIDFVVLLIWEIQTTLYPVIVILTGYRGVKDLRGSRSPLLQTFYRDGVLFFSCLAILSGGNIVVFVVAPVEYTDLLDQLTRCLHSIICCRILLNVKAISRPDPFAPSRAVSSLRFREHLRWTSDSRTEAESIPLETADEHGR